MGSKQSNQSNPEVAKINQLNSRFANTLVDIQKTYNELTGKIKEYCERNVDPKFIDIKEELYSLSNDGLSDEHVPSIKNKLEEIIDILRYKFITSNEVHEYFSSSEYNKEDVLNFNNEIDISRYNNDQYIKTQWFDTAKIFSIIKQKLDLAKKTVVDNSDDDYKIGKRIADALVYYITAINLFIIKIEDEIKFYETHTGYHIPSWFSWMSRSCHGYDSTKKLWIIIKNGIVKEMLYTPNNMLKNYKKTCDELKNILIRFANRDYAVESDINDLIKFKIDNKDISFRTGKIYVENCQSIVDRVNQTITNNIRIYLNSSGNFTFKSSKYFIIKQDSTLTVLLGFEDVDHESVYISETNEYYVSGTKEFNDNELHQTINARKSGKLINIYSRVNTNCVRFGLGKTLISKYQENS